MSEEQLSALLAKLKDDSSLREKLKSAANLDEAAAIANEHGFSVSKSDWVKYQDNHVVELSDEALEGVAAGYGDTCYCAGGNTKDPVDPK